MTTMNRGDELDRLDAAHEAHMRAFWATLTPLPASVQGIRLTTEQCQAADAALAEADAIRLRGVLTMQASGLYVY